MSKSNSMFFLSLQQKNDKIEFNINCQGNLPYTCYGKEFALNDLIKISKYFQLFDSLDECFTDFKQKLDDNNYEIILNDINEKIILKIKTNIVNKDFKLEIPVKKLEQEKIYNRNPRCYPRNYFIEKNENLPNSRNKMWENKYLERIASLISV